MKGHESKIARMEDILCLPVQDPPYSYFCASNINWSKVEGGRQGGDDIALIPFSRVDDFVKGESVNTECPARFRVESRRKRAEGTLDKPRVDGYLEYTLYWCSYGPEDYRSSEPNLLETSSHKPSSGKGSRPGRRHMLRGCICHFTVKRLYTRPLIALVIYNNKRHVDKTGVHCHGALDRESLGTRAMYAPRISEELRRKVGAMLHVGISVDAIVQHHTEIVKNHGGPHNRDDFLTRNDVRNMERLIKNSARELCDVKMWAHRHRKDVFYFCEEPFVLGIQTDWQLQQMLRFGHNGPVASHSVFGSKKYKYGLCSLLAFDSCQNAIPVAWVITSSSSSSLAQNDNKWVSSLVEKIRTKDPRWRPNAIIVDDPSLEASVLRETFQCRSLLCLWRIRRAWIKSLLKYCNNFDIQREIFKHLGKILYCTRCGTNPKDTIEEFMQIYADQSTFIEYFKCKWMPKIELWVNLVRNLPVASQEPCGSLESYNQRLKSRVLNLPLLNSHQRVDLLIHELTTQFHSSYWFDQYISDTGYFENLRENFSLKNPWYQALQIPDIDVLLDEENLQFARVISRENGDVAYTIWNPGSEFSICDCCWSMAGNMCTHVIKVSIFCRNRQVARPLLCAKVYRQALLNLLRNVPEDPLVLEHAISHVARLELEIKSLEDLSNSGLIQALPVATGLTPGDNFQSFPRIH